MLTAIGVVIVVVAVAYLGWATHRDRTRRGLAITGTVTLIALFAGFGLILNERITEITFHSLGTIKTAALEARTDADAISALRKETESHAHDILELRASVQEGAEQVAKTLQYVRSLQGQLDEMRKEMADLDKRTLPSPPTPPRLAYASSTFSVTDSGIAGQVLFQPTGTLALTTVEFDVQIQGSEAVRILKITPSIPIALTVTTSVSSDGRRARLSYTVVGTQSPGFSLELSGPAVLRIEGSPGIEPFDLDAKAQ